MKEIKLYLRKERVDTVVPALRGAGIGHMTITHVHTLRSLAEAEHVRISFETGTTYTEHAKLEFVCSEPDMDKLIQVIEATARTGDRGDGIIFVSPVARAVKIRTGVEGAPRSAEPEPREYYGTTGRLSTARRREHAGRGARQG